MKYNVLQYLENAVERYPEKTAYKDESNTLTFKELYESARAVGTYISERVPPRSPVAVYMEKSAFCIAAFLGIAYAGCCYVPVDAQMPEKRILSIFKILNPAFVIYDANTSDKTDKIISSEKKVIYDEAAVYFTDKKHLCDIRKQAIAKDPLYILFTSGSTGIPKGVTVSHSSVIDHIEWAADTLGIDETAVIGNQVPFYFDMSVLDIYITLRQSATMHILPKKCFLFPKVLIEYINSNKINTVYWVPFVLVNTANSGILAVNPPQYLKRIYFAGDVMPAKQLNIWKEYIPKARYCNLFGPTEITNVFTYYFSDTPLRDNEPVPIGKACGNTRIILFKDDGSEAAYGETGEMCVIGDCIALGYYNDFEKSRAVFVQNPLNHFYSEIMYRTGDLAFYNENGDLIFAGRKDFQIKHCGYRIELSEIEAEISAAGGVESTCCIYNEEKDRIVCFYTGNISDTEIISFIKNRIPVYMIPGELINLKALPLNLNGKIDRTKLIKRYSQSL